MFSEDSDVEVLGTKTCS